MQIIVGLMFRTTLPIVWPRVCMFRLRALVSLCLDAFQSILMKTTRGLCSVAAVNWERPVTAAIMVAEP